MIKLDRRTLVISLKKIRPKYIGCWLIDQLSRPDWFRNLFVNRSSWGAFSIYAHLKRSDNKPKPTYATKEKAEIAAWDMSKKYGKMFVYYKCLFCEGWHISKTQDKFIDGKTPEEDLLKDYVTKEYNVPAELDVKTILSLNIPDLAQVYGGFRGRTLSSGKLRHVWEKIIKAGVTQIIDLRGDVYLEFYPDICKQSGISYFRFPVKRRPHEEDLAKMLELFPEFCALIDRGSFYIHCAEGLHRTDIALSLYWCSMRQTKVLLHLSSVVTFQKKE